MINTQGSIRGHIIRKAFSRDYRRRSAAYVLFLCIATVVMIIGLSALTSVRIQRQSAAGANGTIAARFHAQSAIELGLAIINLDPAWRNNWGSGVWITDNLTSTRLMSLEASILDNEDGDGNSDNDAVVLIGTGVDGHAQHKIKVTLAAVSDRGGMVIAPGSWERIGFDDD